jgi:hypothetical protein
VLDYLGRYTPRGAIAAHRGVSLENPTVSFRWRDSQHHTKQQLMTLSADELLRRFLLQVLPPGLPRIRHSGFLGNRCRVTKLAQCRRLCAPPSLSPQGSPQQSHDPASYPYLTGRARLLCPVCQQGSMLRIAVLAPARSCQSPGQRETS